MIRLFFDTETSGMIPRRGTPDVPRNRPVPVQFAGYLETDAGNVIQVASFLIDPRSWGSDPFLWEAEAEAAHGIPRAVAEAYGVGAQQFANDLMRMVGMSTVAIAHNIEFDVTIVDMAFERLGMPRIRWPAQYCTMKRSIPHVRKPGRFPGEYGWPKLSEAYFHFTGKELSGAHDALVDTYAARAVYRGIRRAEEARQQKEDAERAISPPETSA